MKLLALRLSNGLTQSLPVRGAWVEMPSTQRSGCRRTSLPVRGAWVEISSTLVFPRRCPTSLPVRGAWVEIRRAADLLQRRVRRSPCGERGLKFVLGANKEIALSRSPCGERGLKFLQSRIFYRPPRRSPCGERGLKS